MEKDERLSTIRHSMAHVMAEAVLEMFPGAQIAIGPSIENGFYYDFELPRQLTEADLEEITARMKAIIKAGKEFKRIEVSRDEAREMFKDQKYKLELLDAIPEGETVTIYNQGAFTDLCRGPHDDLPGDPVHPDEEGEQRPVHCRVALRQDCRRTDGNDGPLRHGRVPRDHYHGLRGHRAGHPGHDQRQLRCGRARQRQVA